MKTLLLFASFCLSLPVPAQTTPQLFDALSEAERRGDNAQVVSLYKVFYGQKRNLLSWDYFRGARAAARAGQNDLAFSWLEKMRDKGWRDTESLEKEEAFRSLRTEERWRRFLQSVQESARRALESLDPQRAGVMDNPSLATVAGWCADTNLDAQALYQKVTTWSGFPAPHASGIWLRFENKISDTLTAPYFVYIPSHYNASQATGLLVYLRGGIGAANFPSENDPDYLVENPLLEYCEENNLIEVFPEGNSAVFWSRELGMQNILSQLRQVRQRFYIDDDRVFLAGFSNGGTGVYAFALNVPSPFAGMYAINGALNTSVFLSNLGNRPLFTLASEKDDYSDIGKIRKLSAQAQEQHLPWSITELPGQEHYYRPFEDDAFPPFFASLKTLRRDTVPPSLYWEAADIQRGRCDWLQIDALDLQAPRASWHHPPLTSAYGVERNGRIETHSLAEDSGAVRATLSKNRFDLFTSRVAKVTLYLSPERIDFAQPVAVTVNGKLLLKKRVMMDRAVVVESFQEAFDRRRVYGAKLTLSLPVVRLNEALRRELLRMRDLDQAMQSDPHVNPPGPGFVERVHATFRTHNQRLRKLLAQNGWPDSTVIGEDGANALWLLIQHADEDLSLQKFALEAMEKTVARGGGSKQSLAYLTDRVRINTGQKQVYGTQLEWTGLDSAEPHPKPVEDEAHLDERRAAMGLSPIATYLSVSREAILALRRKLNETKPTKSQ